MPRSTSGRSPPTGAIVDDRGMNIFSTRRGEPGRADAFPGRVCILVSSQTGVERLSVLCGPNGLGIDPLLGTQVVAGWAR